MDGRPRHRRGDRHVRSQRLALLHRVARATPGHHARRRAAGDRRPREIPPARKLGPDAARRGPGQGRRGGQGHPLRRRQLHLDQRHAAAHGRAPDQARARRQGPHRFQGPRRQGALRGHRRRGQEGRRGLCRLPLVQGEQQRAGAQAFVRRRLRALGLGRRLRRLHRRRARRGAAVRCLEPGRRPGRGDGRVRLRPLDRAHAARAPGPGRRRARGTGRR